MSAIAVEVVRTYQVRCRPRASRCVDVRQGLRRGLDRRPSASSSAGMPTGAPPIFFSVLFCSDSPLGTTSSISLTRQGLPSPSVSRRLPHAFMARPGLLRVRILHTWHGSGLCAGTGLFGRHFFLAFSTSPRLISAVASRAQCAGLPLL